MKILLKDYWQLDYARGQSELEGGALLYLESNKGTC